MTTYLLHFVGQDPNKIEDKLVTVTILSTLKWKVTRDDLLFEPDLSEIILDQEREGFDLAGIYDVDPKANFNTSIGDCPLPDETFCKE